MLDNDKELTPEKAIDLVYEIAEDIHSLNQPLTTLFGQLDLLEFKTRGSEHTPQILKCQYTAERRTEILNKMAHKYPRKPSDR
ncbi:MAG: hypothetical protein KC978_19685 [Candidatus Omnitrophica bacterium]|nr:hypothetical protein [Candidatus Omnitrophota bacterium]